MLDSHSLCIWPVHSVCIQFILDTNSFSMSCMCIKLGPFRFVDITVITLCLDFLQVRFTTIQYFKWCSNWQNTSKSSILQINCVSYYFDSQKFQQGCCMHHYTHLFKDCTVRVFSYTIIFRHIMHSESVFCSFLHKMTNEFLTRIFTTSIRL